MAKITKRDAYLRRKYGITEKQYNALLKKQDYKCPVCERTRKEVGKNFHVDHDHVTLEIRGLLCGNCNHRVIGRHRSSSLLARAANYLAGPFTGLIVPKKKRQKRRRRRK